MEYEGKRYFIVDTECWVLVSESHMPYGVMRWETFKEAYSHARELNGREGT
jgi:hypothetical protein